MELFERFAADQRRQNADTLDQSRKIVRRFAEFVGPDGPVNEVSRANAREWKFALQSWPVKANEIREFRGLDLKAVIEANRFLKKPTIGEPTIAKYLSTLGSFGQWLMRHGYIESHPVQGLLPERRRREQRRRPFTIEELNRLFASPLFRGCQGERKEHLPGDCLVRDDRCWLYPLALFSGARLGELCQLTVDDIQLEADIPFLRITDEGDGQTLKNAGSRRDVPIHPELLRIGFAEVHQRPARRRRPSDVSSLDAQ